ncbi:MAG: polysaccharide biosynthesis protein [Chthonomonas sp.]|nr:polysaccharide biosynthesis protein [Chthonomonas sp.]
MSGTYKQKLLQDSLFDLLLLHLSLFAAYAIGNELLWDLAWQDFRRGYSIPVTIFAIGILAWRGIYRIKPRYMGLYDAANILLVGLLSTLLLAAAEGFVNQTRDFRHVVLIPFLFGCLVGGSLVGIRLVRRQLEYRSAARAGQGRRPKKTLVVGAGDAGELIVREIGRSRMSEHMAVGFVDDDPLKRDLIIHGVPVLGKLDDVPQLVKDYNIDELILAIPSAEGTLFRRVMELCEQSKVPLRTLPPVAEILRTGNRIRHQVRDVQIEDLLRREPAQTDSEIARGYLGGETVLVTGAGGSIGSELARQIAKLSPSNLILLGRGENSIFEIEQELIQSGVHPISIIADVRDEAAVESVFRRYQPAVVFHAAAHKHVPLMQANVHEAISNNVRGTHRMAEIAARHGARKFVYISTDKAVNPSNVMGATKRVGEFIIRAIAERSETEFGIVRFGNVLGSRGSLVPVLKQQIRRGGPVRLTHPDMTRYFMTIPEAVQLILQAGAMGEKGELFILDMGEPIKIVDIAKDLIRLHGMVPGEDMEITFMGVRPGEKIEEELTYAQESLIPTTHPKIRMAQADRGLDREALGVALDNLYAMNESGETEQVRQALMTMAWAKDQAPFRYAVVDDSQSISASENPPGQV